MKRLTQLLTSLFAPRRSAESYIDQRAAMAAEKLAQQKADYEQQIADLIAEQCSERTAWAREKRALLKQIPATDKPVMPMISPGTGVGQ